MNVPAPLPGHRAVLPALRGLYAITPESADAGRLLVAVEAALLGGCRWLQYRDKASAPPERRRRAEALLCLCRKYGAALIVNDDLELAAAVGAAGVHLGQGDGDAAAARQRLGSAAVVGVTCHGRYDLALAARARGADYVAFGAVFSSPTKPAAGPAPLELFARARQSLGVPACAIGGITLDNAPAVIAAGADLLAVITDLFAAPDIAARAAAYQRLFEETAHELPQPATL